MKHELHGPARRRQPWGLPTLILTLTFASIPVSAQSTINWNLSPSEVESTIRRNAPDGLSPLDLDVTQEGTAGALFTMVLGQVDGEVHSLVHGNRQDWLDFIADMKPLRGRWLDVEVGYFNDFEDLRYSALFLEDGDDYSFRLDTNSTDDEFQRLLQRSQDQGLALVDFEAYERPSGSGTETRYAGVWVNDPNQPKTILYYGLERADISDLLRPLAGRVIDYERYYSTTHGETRYALIIAMLPDSRWGHIRGMSQAKLLRTHQAQVRRGAKLIDLESYTLAGIDRYDAVWGPAVKSMNEVAAIASDPAPEVIPTGLQQTLATYETSVANGGSGGTVAIYAKNLRTGQTIGYRQNRSVYLASTAKIATHIKYWREVESGHLDPQDTAPFTNGIQQIDPWWVDGGRGGTWGLNAAHLGQSFSLNRYDRAMMDVSDNAATSLLLDHPDFGLSFDRIDLNEWLASLDGIGQGFSPMVSIHDVDRAIMWQGQVERFPDEESLFRVPGWALESYFRGSPFAGTLPITTWLNANRPGWIGNDPTTGLPDYHNNDGHQRHYEMGLNSATPKAMTLLLEGLREGNYLNPQNTRDAIDLMTENTPFGNCTLAQCRDSFPPDVDVFAKGGAKGGASRPLSGAALFEMGRDSVALTVLTEDHGVGPNRTRGQVDRDFTQMAAEVALEVVQALGANLGGCAPFVSGFSQRRVQPGDHFEAWCALRNEGGGDASPFAVGVYASKDTRIDANDELIGYAFVNGLAGNDSEVARVSVSFPSRIRPGTYYVGALIDVSNAVGEWDEGNNAGRLSRARLVVEKPGT